MKIHDDIQPSILRPAHQPVKILQTSPWVKLIVIDKIFFDPESHRHANSVQSVGHNLVDILLRDPRIPMRSKGSVGSFLADCLDTFPLIVGATAAHAVPFVVGHPWFNDELRAKIHAPDLWGRGQPSGVRVACSGLYLVSRLVGYDGGMKAYVPLVAGVHASATAASRGRANIYTPILTTRSKQALQKCESQQLISSGGQALLNTG
jgi:hypothetical protein